MSRKRGILVLGGGALALAGAAAAGRVGLGGDGEAGVVGQEVQRGPLRITVVERANLKAAGSVDLLNEIEGRTTILSLIEEGTWVEPGELLCELDASDQVEDRVQQEILVQNAQAAYVNAKQNYEIQRSQNASDIARAQRELDFARLDLEKYIEGEAPQEKERREEEIILADEELKRATQDLMWSEKLAERGFLEKTQLDADRLAQTRADIQLRQRKRSLELFEQYEFPRARSEYVANVEEKERELERVELQAEARIVDDEADMRSKKAKLDLEREKLAKLDNQIEKARIVAPVAGMVVYAREEGSRWGGGEPIAEGTEVRERQAILSIPSSQGMIAEASLHESVLEKVEVGMPVAVTVDALVDRTYAGSIKFKSILPDQNSWWANPDLRVYRTEVSVLEDDPRMQPGMSCSIEILVDELEDVLHVPMQSVFRDGEQTVCFVHSAGSFAKRPVETGESNGKWVEIRSGLETGEIVSLSQPAGTTLAPASVDRPQEGGFPVPEEGAKRAARAQHSGAGSKRESGRDPARAGEGGKRGARSGEDDGKAGKRGEARSEPSAGSPPAGAG